MYKNYEIAEAGTDIAMLQKVDDTGNTLVDKWNRKLREDKKNIMKKTFFFVVTQVQLLAIGIYLTKRT